MSDNEKQLCAYFNKQNGLMLYSGTLCLEYALRLVKADKRKVIIPNNVCYSVLSSVLQVGGIPVLIEPENGFVLSVDDIKRLKQRDDIDIVIIVHYLGIKADLRSIRSEYPDFIIIEDCAQFFSDKGTLNDIGIYSDYVITSFGKSKLLGYGIGGMIFSNYDLDHYIIKNYVEAREYEELAYPYSLPESFKPPVSKLIEIARTRIEKQRKIAGLFMSIFEKIKTCCLVCERESLSLFSWNRFPVCVCTKESFEIVVKTAKENGILFQLPHEKMLQELPILSSREYYYIPSIKPSEMYYIFFRTKENDMERLLKWKEILLGIFKNNI